ncbi:MAG: putative toxin-antitoxin system toxin component, PIN family [Nitrospinae bacterium]|nr:putative toxin-antitoxin system toxin component, PIN family [Nitrospinota bacterium]
MKIFLDTNVLVSALFSASGSCAEVFRTVSKSKRFKLAISDHVLEELSRAIVRKSKIPLDHPALHELFTELGKHEIVPSPSATADVFVRDPKDIPVLVAAIECEADILITGDNDLLVLGTVKNMRIMKPRNFVDLFVSGYH